MSKPNRDLLVTPICCDAIQKFAVVVLRYVNHPYDDRFYENAKYLNTHPIWTVKARNENELLSKGKIMSAIQQAHFCPFCGSPMPDIQTRKTNKRICKITDGGYYCDRCKERCSECRCAPMEYAWEPCSLVPQDKNEEAIDVFSRMAGFG